jgi:hypothetical protein
VRPRHGVPELVVGVAAQAVDHVADHRGREEEDERPRSEEIHERAPRAELHERRHQQRRERVEQRGAMRDVDVRVCRGAFRGRDLAVLDDPEGERPHEHQAGGREDRNGVVA